MIIREILNQNFKPSLKIENLKSKSKKIKNYHFSKSLKN